VVAVLVVMVALHHQPQVVLVVLDYLIVHGQLLLQPEIVDFMVVEVVVPVVQLVLVALVVLVGVVVDNLVLGLEHHRELLEMQTRVVVPVVEMLPVDLVL